MELAKTMILRPKPVRVSREGATTEREARTFDRTFKIGRDPDCELYLDDVSVSKQHVELRMEGHCWRVRDLGSTNGTYLNGRRVQDARLPDRARLELGLGGPALLLQVAASRPRRVEPAFLPGTAGGSVTQMLQRYLAPGATRQAGPQTLMMRRAFQRVQRAQTRKYSWIIIAVCLILAAVTGIALLQQRKISQLRSLAATMFYSMKTVELQVAQMESRVAAVADSALHARLLAKRLQGSELQQRYNQFIDELDVYGEGLSPENRAIMRTARNFGEIEIDIPPSFFREVHKYIRNWKMTPRLKLALQNSQQNGYGDRIVRQLLEHHLPPQFFFIALQESDFQPRSVGPETRFGIAKGIWQFIPGTARKYNLRLGPLVELPRYDPRDERFDFEKSTDAAVNYLQDIYNTVAQASGLLVIASYNFGEHRVIGLIEQLPENPRERNFWQLLKKYRHRIPKETYDYVFYIFSAAVIAENPRLFGFEFESPLASAYKTAAY